MGKDSGIPLGGQARDHLREEIVLRVRELNARLKQNARDPDNPPGLLAVTKTVPVEVAALLPRDGIVGVGENRVQDIRAKMAHAVECRVEQYDNLPIHMIGRLQTNKVADIIGRVTLIQSLDRIALAKEIDRQAGKRCITAGCLVQVNIGQEAQKGGVSPEETMDAVRAFARLPNLRVEGLMAVLPQSDDEALLGLLFRRMRGLFDRIRDEAIAGVSMARLSMGMSGDAMIAAREGSTMVRLGSAIFGPRQGVGQPPNPIGAAGQSTAPAAQIR
ncbi:MAG: YggS family pyridoxal phosphate-dependent enzyme [Oscillospiraceae bacterium]|nr:YggS family pyridoxal phosphate-dependent enzyme [Oscillospiraceae bacterium]